ncbi:MAG: hypothetical protein AB7U85_03150 [Alphaproteobacteria bacterium]
MAELTNGFEALEELGAFELAGNKNDKPLSEKDINILKIVVGQIEQTTKAMSVMANVAEMQSIEACIENVHTIKTDPSMQDFCQVMPQSSFKKMIDAATKDMPENVAEKFGKLNKEQKINVLAAAPENMSFFLDRKPYNELEEKLVGLYAKVFKEYPDIISRGQDKDAQEVLTEVLSSGAREMLDNAWKSEKLQDRVDAVRTTCQALFKKDERDYPFKICSGGNGIAGAYDEKADFGVVSDRLLSFPDWSMAMFTTIHENQHRLQHLQIKKLKAGDIQEDTAEYFQARIFKANFEGGYLVDYTKRTDLEKQANYEDYIMQPVELNANNAGFNFAESFSVAIIEQKLASYKNGILSSRRAKEQLKRDRERDPESLTRKPTNDEYRKAGLFSLMNGKNNSR